RVPVERGAGAVAVSQSSAGTSLPQQYLAALQPYLEAHKRLSSDTANGLSDLLNDLVQKLQPFSSSPDYQRIVTAVKGRKDDSIESIRDAWKEISAAMIAIGKSAGVPSNEATVKVFKCPMKHALWLQLGEQTANPYYGASMLTCGSAVESLPKVDISAPTTRRTPTATPTLAVPRSAVIDTGSDKIVYVESSPGIFDARSVKIGPLAGDEYPVLEGLAEHDH